MSKKIKRLMITFCLIFSLIQSNDYSSEVQVITQNTIITVDNLVDVLNYLGYGLDNSLKLITIESAIIQLENRNRYKYSKIKRISFKIK
jgi:hypothetical protein